MLNPPRMINLLVVSDNPDFLEFALSTDRLQKLAITEFKPNSYLKTDEYKNRSVSGRYDLVIYDQCLPDVMPPCGTVFWGVIPDQRWQAVEQLDVAPVANVNNAHPIMFDLQMGNVNILNSYVVKGPQGSVPLIDSISGPIMMIGPRASFEDLVIGFPLTSIDESGNQVVNTDWPKKLSFPFFVQNMVLALGGASQFGISRNFEPGELIRIKPRLPYSTIEVTKPNGQTSIVQANSDKRFVFSETEECGVYAVKGQGQDEIDHLFTVNLLDRLESDLAVREKLDLGLEEIVGKQGSERVRKAGWTWLVLAGLLILVVEWYIFNKRVLI